MAKRKRRDLITCPYCRKELRHCDSERDHIPPKCLFPSPRPSNLLTVRCCGECHDELSIGDEPLKAMGGLGVFRNSDATRITDEVHRGLKRSPWWKSSLVNAAKIAKPLDLVVGSEIVRLPKIVITGELAVAVQTSLKRTVIGLLFDWDPNRVVTLSDVDVFQIPEERPGMLIEIVGEMPLRFGAQFGTSFCAAWDFSNDDRERGAMILSFYAGLSFVAFIKVPENMIQNFELSDS